MAGCRQHQVAHQTVRRYSLGSCETSRYKMQRQDAERNARQDGQ